jgi:hypothetical protein
MPKTIIPSFQHSNFFSSACSAISAVNVLVVNVLGVNVFGGEKIEENSFGE